MKVLQNISINNSADIIYAKNSLKNILKNYKSKHTTYLIFALMELTTNIIKHAKEGKLYLFESNNELILATTDLGGGIEDINWSLQNGTSRKENSLGLGLYQINRDSYYHLEIFSLTDNHIHGSIFIVKPRNFNPEILSLQLLYPTEDVCGDLFSKKGKYLLVADASGHGKKANITAEKIKSYFYNNAFSCFDIDYFYEQMHNYLKSHKFRGAAVSILELSLPKIKICGVGNISFWKSTPTAYQFFSQKDGVIGEYFSSAQYKEILLEMDETFIVTTDGIDNAKMTELLMKMPKNTSAIMIALASMHFASVLYDDKTILIIQRSRNEK